RPRSRRFGPFPKMPSFSAPHSAGASRLKQYRFHKVELLDEADLTEAAGVSIAGLNVDSKRPVAKVNAEIRPALSAGAGDLPALKNRAASARGHHVVGSREGHHP